MKILSSPLALKTKATSQRPMIAIPITTPTDLSDATGTLTVRRKYDDTVIAQLHLDSVSNTDPTANNRWEAYFAWPNAAATETVIDEYKFDCQLTVGGSKRTWANGVCEIIEDQTRE